jgi:hypothetical protein
MKHFTNLVTYYKENCLFMNLLENIYYPKLGLFNIMRELLC